MRLYLFPITGSRTLIYCKRLGPAATSTTTTSSTKTSSSSTSSPTSSSLSSPAPPNRAKPPILDRITDRANSTWISWESAESGWKRTVTGWGNALFARIPYQEWGLKSIPPLKSPSTDNDGTAPPCPPKIDVVFPNKILDSDAKVQHVLRELSSKSVQAGYRTKMLWTVVAMPFTAPLALVPIVPNLPFFYLVFRAWSYWRAIGGAKHVEHLLDNGRVNLVRGDGSRVLGRLYEVGIAGGLRKEQIETLKHKMLQLREGKKGEGKEESVAKDADVERAALHILGKGEVEGSGADDRAEGLLYPKGHAKVVALSLNMPEVEVELERARAQVESALKESEQSGRVEDK